MSTALPSDVACSAVRDAAAEGYEVLALSGGEPLLYNALNSLLDTARDAGLRTALTTNGTVLTQQRLAALKGRLDLLTLSLDGVPDSHNKIRNSASAFARLERNLPALRDSGIPFGFIFTLTQNNVHELDWVANFALENGAKLLQIHPLEMAGRAHSQMQEAHPDDLELGFGFAEALRLQDKFGDRMRVHIDVATRTGVQALFNQHKLQDHPNQLADAVSPIVVEADGTVVPLSYGFPRKHSLGSLYDYPLSRLGQRWLSRGFDQYRAMLSRLQDDKVWPKRLPVLNLYEAAVAVA